MRPDRSEAQALMEGDRKTIARVAGRLLKPLRNNLVERPWGGMWIRDFKRLDPTPENSPAPGIGLGESFELAAFDADREARQYPSRVRFPDGSEITLPELLRERGEELLGAEFVSTYGRQLPLLPKFLDVKELLSVQGHPTGNTEVYVIIDAEPGATIRLGFSEDIDAVAFRAELEEGRKRQESLQSAVADRMSGEELQDALTGWLASRDSRASDLPFAGSDELEALATELRTLYWRVLNAMNAIAVEPGQVIHNANPRRIVAETDAVPSAEVHALGNPEGREILALEIRRPGPTFRAWDNVRFPLREIAVREAIEALNLKRTDPAEFLVDREPVAGRPGTTCSIDSEAFRLEHLMPTETLDVQVPAGPPHCLHAIRGSARFLNGKGEEIGDLDRGESALVPIRVGGYTVQASSPEAEIVKVSLPF